MSPILVFVMTGCPACHEYVPRFRKLSGRLPVKIIDITRDRRGAALADHLKIKATPTTVVKSGTTLTKKVGAISDTEIRKLLSRLQ